MRIKSVTMAGWLGACLALFACGAFAVPMNYNFSYRFTESGQNLLVNGSFTGEDHGTFADNITNILMSYSQAGGPFTAISGPLYIVNYFSAFSATPPSANGQVYYNLAQNNFVILNCDYGTSPCASTAGFLLRNGAGGGDEDTNLFNFSTMIGRESSASNTWSLTSTPVPTVPAPGTLALLGLGLLGVGAARRKVSSEQVKWGEAAPVAA